MSESETRSATLTEDDYTDDMTRISHLLDGIFNGDAQGDDRESGFILLVFPFNSAQGRTYYVSNGADRKDVVVLLKEMIARFEGQPEVQGTA